MDFLDPPGLILSTADYVSNFNKKMGTNFSVDFVKATEAMNAQSGMPELVSHEYCGIGHKYRYGSDSFPRDLQLAADYYKRAADLGNAEGMYNLAQLMFTGSGVQLDVAQALELYMKAATQTPFKKTSELGIFEQPNIGVCEAQYALGLCYFEGTGVNKGLATAMKWFRKACYNGSAFAANNLGSIYKNETIDGKHNLVKAEQFYRLAASDALYPDCNAMSNLAVIYNKKGDLERALKWCFRAEENGSKNPRLHAMKTNIKSRLYAFWKSNIPDWELGNGHCFDGMTVTERTHRYLAARHTLLFNYAKSKEVYESKLTNWSLQNVCTHEFNEIKFQLSTMHSTYGQRLWTAKKHILNATRLMIDITKDSEFPSIENCEKFVKEFSAGVQVDDIFDWPSTFSTEKALSVMKLLLKQKLPFDEEVRICCVALQSHCPEPCINFLDECILLYPKNVFFLESRACMKEVLKRYEEGISDTKLALQLDPENIEILCDQAQMMGSIMEESFAFTPQEVIAAYKRFLRLAPKDHRRVPDVLYAIANITLLKFKFCKSIDREIINGIFSEAKKYYELGLAAEKQQLSVFLPYESMTKPLFEHLFPQYAEKLGSHLSLSLIVEPVPKSEKCCQLIDKLTDPNRIIKVRRHRKSIKQCTEKLRFSTSIKPPRKQTLPQSLIDLKSLNLWDMDPSKDMVYKGCVLSVTIIDDLNFTGSSICLLLEDTKGCVERCFIYNSPHMYNLAEARTVFSVGCKMSIINPYRRICLFDKQPAIRVDDPNSIVFNGFLPDICRYCCEPDATKKCGRCHAALYCDETCQRMDWKQMKHKLVCNVPA